MDWETDLHRLHSCKASAHSLSADPKEPDWLQDIPQMEDSATFDTILGSDVLYEVCSAAPAVLMESITSAACSLALCMRLQDDSDL